VERINHDTLRRRPLVGLLRQGGLATPVEVPATWDINIQPDHDGELARGRLASNQS
jgi:hypothetical protein